MYVRDMMRSLLRRWYLVAMALVLSAGAAYGLAQAVRPTYKASASVVLVPPETTLGDTGNPYLFLGGLDQTVDVLARSMNSGATRNDIKREVPDGDFAATADFTTSAPIIVAEAEDTSAAGADRLLDVVLARVSDNLAALQADLSVQSKAQISDQVVSRSAKPEVMQKARYRQVVMGALGVLLVLLLPVAVVDSLLQRRRIRRAQAPPARPAGAGPQPRDAAPAPAPAPAPEKAPEKAATEQGEEVPLERPAPTHARGSGSPAGRGR